MFFVIFLWIGYGSIKSFVAALCIFSFFKIPTGLDDRPIIDNNPSVFQVRVTSKALNVIMKINALLPIGDKNIWNALAIGTNNHYQDEKNLIWYVTMLMACLNKSGYLKQ